MNVLLRNREEWVQGYAYNFTSASHALQCDFVNAEQLRASGVVTVDYENFIPPGYFGEK